MLGFWKKEGVDQNEMGVTVLNNNNKKKKKKKKEKGMTVMKFEN